ncbi:MAG: ectonucleotide pyrophosphatase/phosphodiesterase [Gemmatimonadaceae bacterium]|nr:ectonucleotide pyrophosphatase/phosphodiesterase [Gemmatimonadaceae bacterium]
MRLFIALLVFAATACVHAPRGSTAATPPSDRIVLLVSLDGFRADYINRPGAVRLRQLAASGVRAERMVPAFPSKTFPNHYTIVTGLYPEHHGIIANTMFDATIGRTFTVLDTAVTHDPRWWGGEPLWNTVERQGKKSASFFWVGSDIKINGQLPTWYRTYDGRVPNWTRVRTVLEWLSQPAGTGPSFVSMYVSDMDDAGHAYGPNAPQVDSALARVDSLVGALVDGISTLGLSGSVNLVVVSDHGMAALAADRVIYLDDYVDLSRMTVVDLSPVGSLVPAAGYEAEAYRRLTGAHPRLKVYRKGELPARLHFNANARITPLVTIADEGWTLTTRAIAARVGLPRGGAHGFDNLLPSMGALFVAAGPDFRAGVVVPPFQNIHVYSLLAGLLGVTPAPNDGSPDSTRALLRAPAR